MTVQDVVYTIINDWAGENIESGGDGDDYLSELYPYLDVFGLEIKLKARFGMDSLILARYDTPNEIVETIEEWINTK